MKIRLILAFVAIALTAVCILLIAPPAKAAETTSQQVATLAPIHAPPSAMAVERQMTLERSTGPPQPDFVLHALPVAMHFVVLTNSSGGMPAQVSLWDAVLRYRGTEAQSPPQQLRC